MSMLIDTYFSLLTDSSRLLGVPIGFPDDLDENWILIEGPKLDKGLLQWIEGNAEKPHFPDWLLPVWNLFLLKGEGRVLRCLRTILVFGYKAEHKPTKEQLNEAVNAYIDANRMVAVWGEAFKASPPSVTIREARRQVGAVISRLDFSNVIPSHGPGAVFPTRKASEKGNFGICTPILEYYPYDTLFNCLGLIGSSDLRSQCYHTYDTIVCKMVAVPKDSRGPRLISVHPSESIWLQQGQRRVLERGIERHPWTSGKINFTDQSINGRLALTSSADRGFTTIDLKEASDRISKHLVDYLFGYTSKLLSCSRASQVRLLDGSFVEIEAWAPMGNCLTFPVESLVFWSLVRAGIRSRYGVICDDVYVFGDDIIVPTQYYDGAIYGLVQAGLIPNFNKTFRKGFFRESCGVDAYHGEDVTPYRCKVGGITSYSDGESLCDLAKRLRQGGYADTSTWLYSQVSKRFGRLSLTNNPNCQGLIEYTEYGLDRLMLYEPRILWNESLHCYQVPFRKRIRTVEVLSAHAWWHVQDSLLALERMQESTSLNEWDTCPTIKEINGERGLEYPHPRGERLYRGLCNLMHD